jgi:hypothetical protein
LGGTQTYGLLYCAAQTSQTAGTLYAICPKIGWNIHNKEYKKK